MNRPSGLYLVALLLLPVFGSAIAESESIRGTASSRDASSFADPAGWCSAVESPRIRQVAAEIVHQVSAGERTDLLRITFEIDNDSTAEVTIDADNLRILTVSGTLLAAPQIRQDGLGSDRIHLAERTRTSVELLFEFFPGDSWSAFEFSWGAHLAQETRSGRVEFVRSPRGFQVLEPPTPESTRITTDVVEAVRSVHTVGSYGCPAGSDVPPDIWQFHVFSGWPGIHPGKGPDAVWPAIWGGGLGTSFFWADPRSRGAGCPSCSTGSCRRSVLRVPCRHDRPSRWIGSDLPPGPQVRTIHRTTNPRFPRPGEPLDGHP